MGRMSRIWPKLVFDEIVPLVGNLQIGIGTIGILCCDGLKVDLVVMIM